MKIQNLEIKCITHTKHFPDCGPGIWILGFGIWVLDSGDLVIIALVHTVIVSTNSFGVSSVPF